MADVRPLQGREFVVQSTQGYLLRSFTLGYYFRPFQGQELVSNVSRQTPGLDEFVSALQRQHTRLVVKSSH